MTIYFLSQADLRGLCAERQGTSTFAPVATEHLAWMDVIDPDSFLPALSQPRPSQSPKGFFLPAAESMGQYGPGATAAQTQTKGAPQSEALALESPPLALIGVRACELRARNYLDKVLLEGDVEDPLYRQRREATTIVSCDCVDCTESCFCTLVGGEPFPTDGYDVNLTPVDEGYVAEVATDRGRQWLGGERIGKLSEATAAQLARRDELRQNMVRRLKEQNAALGFTASDQAQPKLPNDNDERWQQFAADCVECGACTNICPTCHCFYLYDQAPGPEQFERIRTWDSCLFSTYHRMAGGESTKLTPRPRLYSRLANRVLHKFTYSPQQYALLGCVGCGRCVDACIGAIDIREVVQELGE